MQNQSDETDALFMRAALEQARLADSEGEVPVGAVIVFDGQVIASARNAREATQDPTTHAELIAIREAARKLGTWRLSGATCYVTLEPCPMCAGALVNSRIDRVVFGADDPKAGATTTLYNIGSDARLNHRFTLKGEVLRDECAQLLSAFFARIRSEQRANRAERNRDSVPPVPRGPSRKLIHSKKERAMQDYQEAMLKSLVAVAWADGRIESEETEVIEALLSAFEVSGDDADKIREYAKTPRSIDDIPVSDLSAEDRRVVLQHAVILTYIDGTQSDEEVKVLNALVRKMRVPEDEATAILAAATDRAKRLISVL